jgi:RNA polymerase sporulation-specific sigma factor
MFRDLLRKALLIVRKVLVKSQDNEVYYIGGPEILPTPLSSEEEAGFLAKLGTNDDLSAKSTLIERNLRLVVYIARKFENTGINVEDLISIGTIGLIKAVNTFKTDKNIKLATYASRCIENEILMFLRRNIKTRNEVSFDEPLNVDWEGNEMLLSDILGTDFDIVSKQIEAEVDRQLLSQAIGKLTKREQTIVELRFGLSNDGDEMTQKEVADFLGISQSYISRLEKKIIVRLKKEMAKFV